MSIREALRKARDGFGVSDAELDEALAALDRAEGDDLVRRLRGKANDARNWADNYSPAEDYRQHGWLISHAEAHDRAADALAVARADNDALRERVEELDRQLKLTGAMLQAGDRALFDLAEAELGGKEE